MIIVDTVYPCTICKNEIDPQDDNCKFCGAEQPALKGRIFYNVFYRRLLRAEFNLMIGGIVLEIADAKDFLEQQGTSEGYEYFIGSYINTEEPVDQQKFPVQNWIPFVDGQFEGDLGPQEIRVTSLE